MAKVAVPCHRSHAVFDIPDANYLGAYLPHGEAAAPDPAAEVRRALEHGGGVGKSRAQGGARPRRVARRHDRALRFRRRQFQRIVNL